MTLDEAVGIKTLRDVVTGKELSHEERMDRYIEFLGGLEEVEWYIPFDIDMLAEKYKEDRHFNNTPMKTWDYASGFREDGIDVVMIGTGIVNLYRKYGITCYSNSDGVSILKRAAERLVLMMGGEDNVGDPV